MGDEGRLLWILMLHFRELVGSFVDLGRKVV